VVRHAHGNGVEARGRKLGDRASRTLWAERASAVPATRGHVSPPTAEHVAADLSGQIDLIIDGGPTAVIPAMVAPGIGRCRRLIVLKSFGYLAWLVSAPR
jgi:hypothetical protein